MAAVPAKSLAVKSHGFKETLCAVCIGTGSDGIKVHISAPEGH